MRWALIALAVALLPASALADNAWLEAVDGCASAVEAMEPVALGPDWEEVRPFLTPVPGGVTQGWVARDATMKVYLLAWADPSSDAEGDRLDNWDCKVANRFDELPGKANVDAWADRALSNYGYREITTGMGWVDGPLYRRAFIRCTQTGPRSFALVAAGMPEGGLEKGYDTMAIFEAVGPSHWTAAFCAR